MDGATPAEEFPSLYRAILDGVAELERLGQRDEAQRVRAAATAAYSGSWADAGHRRLELLLVRIDRSLTNQEHAGARLPRGDRSRGLGSLFRRLRAAR